jgi:septal ring factor EnvC (AmiA/AmiB activator)
MIAGCTSTPKSESVAQAVISYKEEIQKIVTDPGRAATLTALVDQTDAQRREAEAEAAAFAADFEILNADYDATKGQFTALMTKHRAQRRQFAEALLSIRAKMVAGTTPQEWEALSKVREKALETMFKAELPAESPSTLTAKIGDTPC